MKKRIFAATAAIFMLFSLIFGVSAEESAPELNCESAILMEAATGTVLFEKNADKALPPASVTKIMTLLLTVEAIEKGLIGWNDTITASANAASMGGSQIYLKEGEEMSVEDLVKSVVIASANDAAVALAEAVAGSESVFVSRMNTRAEELGMKNTHFENTNGLDDTVTNHVTSARDIAIMSRELIGHEKILQYSSTWMDSVRNGEFGLTNTNRLVRFYNGATGLKTGSTAKAKFCMSATAERDGMSLIAVIMAAPSRDERNNAAKTLLDYGFANFSLYKSTPELPKSIGVAGGDRDKLEIEAEQFCAVVKKGSDGKIELATDLPEKIKAPVTAGDKVGEVVYKLDGAEIGKTPIVAKESVNRAGFLDIFFKILGWALIKG